MSKESDDSVNTSLPKLVIASGEASFDLFYRTRFLTPDPVIYIETPTTRSLLLSDLEVDRGKKQSTVDEVIPTRTFEERLKANGKRASLPAIAALFLKDRSFDRVLVPFDLASGYSRALESEGIEIVVSDGELYPERALKKPDEIHWIRHTQVGVEESLEIALELLRKAEIRDGFIWVDWDTPDIGTGQEVDQRDLDGARLRGPAYHRCRRRTGLRSPYGRNRPSSGPSSHRFRYFPQP